MRTKVEILQGEDENLFLTSCYFDPVKFFERVLGYEAKDFHKEWISLLKNHKEIAISAPTGFGKTTLFGVFWPIWTCFYKPNSLALIISKSIRTQSANTLEEIKYTIENNEVLSQLVPEGYKTTWTKEKIFMTNGSKIQYSSFSVNVRGIQADYVFADEIACVPDDTECLTLNGWKNYKEITTKELIATYNIYKKTIEYQIPTEIKSFNYKGDLIKIGGKSLDILTTPNHRSIVKNRYGKELIKRADNITPNDRIVVNARFDYPESEPVGEELAELIGWIITEGHFTKNRNSIIISQNEGKNLDRIKFILNKLSVPFSLYNKNQSQKSLFIKDCEIRKKIRNLIPDRKLNGRIISLPVNESKALFSALISGDGHIKKDGRIQFIQKSKKNNDWFSILALRLGYHTNTVKRKTNDVSDTYLTKRNSIWVAKNKSVIDYSGIVWCPKVPNGTWVARRNGKVFITGNTYDNHELFFRDVMTRVVSKNGQVAAVSTPLTTSDLLARLMNTPGFFSKTYAALLDKEGLPDLKGESIWPEKFPKDYLLEKRGKIGIANFERNYMGNPKAESSEMPIFTLSSVEDCYDLSRPFTTKIEGGIVYVGCDFAISSGPRADFDCYIVIEDFNDFIIIKNIERHKGIPNQTRQMRIKEICDIYKPTRVIVDESNLGTDVLRDLISKGIPAYPQSFNPSARKKILLHLQNIIDNKMLVIPRKIEEDNPLTKTMTDLLTEELIGMKEEESKITRVKHIVSTSAHDDTVMSLAMACSAVRFKQEFQDFIASDDDIPENSLKEEKENLEENEVYNESSDFF